MKKQALTIDINARLNIDRRTAELCLKIVEMYCNDNDKEVLMEYENDGSIEYSYINRYIDKEPVG